MCLSEPAWCRVAEAYDLNQRILTIPHRFNAQLAGLRWTANHGANRHFLVMPLLRPPCNGLNRLLSSCNQVAVKFRQPELYEISLETRSDNADDAVEDTRSTSSKGVISRGTPAPASALRSSATSGDAQEANNDDLTSCFHISIAWSHVAHDSKELTEIQHSRAVRELQSLNVPVSAVKVRIGNAVNMIDLGFSEVPKTTHTWLV